jgi:hypothetical protein
MNWVCTNPRRAGHGGVLRGGAENREKRVYKLCEFSGESESITQVLVRVMPWRSSARAQFIGGKSEMDEIHRAVTALASLPARQSHGESPVAAD